MDHLGTFGGPRGAGLSVNQHDQVVGRMFDPSFVFQPFFYADGAVVNLGTATGTAGAIANAINNRGDIAGTDVDAGRLPVTGWVGRPGHLQSLAALLVDGNCLQNIDAVDINDSGAIVVNARPCGLGQTHAFVFEPIKVPRTAVQ